MASVHYRDTRRPGGCAQHFSQSRRPIPVQKAQLIPSRREFENSALVTSSAPQIFDAVPPRASAGHRAAFRVAALKEVMERDHPPALSRRQHFLRRPAGQHVEEWGVERGKLLAQSKSSMWKARTSPSR